MNQERLVRLLQEYFDNTINRDDCIELLRYLKASDTDNIADLISEEMLKLHQGAQPDSFKKHSVLQRIKHDPRFTGEEPLSQIHQPKIVKFYQRKWLKIAAAILFVCTGLGLYVVNHQNQICCQNLAQTQINNAIRPGGNKATLTLSNGQVIVLDTANNGLIANTGKTRVIKSNKAQLVYNATTQSAITPANAPVVYNTLSTPRGGMFQVVLPDGTQVWLNSASSLKFPTTFSGSERRVTLTGEGYFEVAKNKEKPFYVDINHVEVRVLGTHFNIAAYEDDNDITTTLLEGAVQVKNSDQSSTIKPGEQAVVKNDCNAIKVSPANIEKAMAWKNGYFIFGDEDIKSIMKKISRWYDVEVVYSGDFNNIRFGGTFYRSKSIDELLSNLEAIGKINFKIAGRRIIVMK
ncbi:FecR family protein [Mucilaginibacter yixingensis]|uniref:FecR family protein n=1 Tax=Mucilaginibacter yixingensis TaxID=1295612 RepID=A0A2T5JAH3_9SPHI|nr:FecR family protein [Mucilaginibacter yixingensis]PTQ97863.1 FecR family protein [Mucilaginibacter yixingensis]